jgi:hypothetical protein
MPLAASGQARRSCHQGEESVGQAASIMILEVYPPFGDTTHHEHSHLRTDRLAGF